VQHDDVWESLNRIHYLECKIRAKEKLKQREVRWTRLLILSLALAAILAAAVALEHKRKAAGLTHYDEVQMMRLVDSID